MVEYIDSKKVKQFMIREKTTQTELAQKLKVHFSTISKMLSKEKPKIHAFSIDQLSAALNCYNDDIIYRANDQVISNSIKEKSVPEPKEAEDKMDAILYYLKSIDSRLKMLESIKFSISAICDTQIDNEIEKELISDKITAKRIVSTTDQKIEKEKSPKIVKRKYKKRIKPNNWDDVLYLFLDEKIDLDEAAKRLGLNKIRFYEYINCFEGMGIDQLRLKHYSKYFSKSSLLDSNCSMNYEEYVQKIFYMVGEISKASGASISNIFMQLRNTATLKYGIVWEQIKKEYKISTCSNMFTNVEMFYVDKQTKSIMYGLVFDMYDKCRINKKEV